MQMLQQENAVHGQAFFAHHQTAGKGQREKAWDTEPNSNILLSVVLDASFLSLSNQFYLSAAVALGVHDFFGHYAGNNTKIKWPNDIYWQNRKAGGILIENVVRGNDWKWAVAGIGLNINQSNFPEHLLSKAISLKQVIQKELDTVAMAHGLCIFLEKRYQQLKKGETDAIIENYNNQLYKRNEQVKLKKGNIVFPCTIEGVSHTGQLLLSGGLQDEFSFGEVEWVI
jgi:BirA family biotin operon repressor/biotin-[acetyl-CoA-carboxylase] ligase